MWQNCCAKIWCNTHLHFQVLVLQSNGNDGLDLKARNKGQANVSRDVRKIFAPLAQAPADQVARYGNLGIFSAWMKSKMELPGSHYPSWVFAWFKDSSILGIGEWNMFEQIESKNASKGSSSFYMGTTEGKVKSYHEQVRGKPAYYVKNQQNKVYVDDFGVVERYIKKVQQRVGRLKSGWYFAGKQLGKIKSVGWIEAQSGQDKICIPNLEGNKPSVTVGSQGRERYRRWYPLFQAAINHRAYAMRVKMLQWLSSPKNHGTLRQVIAKMPSGFNVINTNP
jgi:hypothetical protein